MKDIEIKSSEDVYNVLKEYSELDHEVFVSIFLDSNGKIIDNLNSSNNLIDETTIKPREIYDMAFELNASHIIFGHNHPSGNVEPSLNDLKSTQKLIEIGDTLDFKIVDHVIVSEKGYFSMRQNIPELFENKVKNKKENTEMEM